MRVHHFSLGIVFLLISINISFGDEKVIRKIGTWNMKWLGTSSGSQLDPIENVHLYVNEIQKSGATLLALQEIAGTHSENGKPKCFYLDLIVTKLNEGLDTDKQWSYSLDNRNGNQRLAYLYKNDQWQLTEFKAVYPGSSFRGLRRPYIAEVQSKGGELTFHFVNVHLKAFPDAFEKREKQMEDLVQFLEQANLDNDILIAGDTNIYKDENNTEKPLKENDYKAIWDNERTSIHDNVKSQRFDRFYCTLDLWNEVKSAIAEVKFANLVDAIAPTEDQAIIEYDENISDHFLTIMNIDISKER